MKDFIGKIKCKQFVLEVILGVWKRTDCLSVTVCAGRKSAQQGLGTSRLPTFSPQEKSYIKGTCDFLGIGHFTTRYITQKNNPASRSSSSYFTDRDLAELVDPRWPDPGSEWLYSVPWGFRRLLNFVKVINSESYRRGNTWVALAWSQWTLILVKNISLLHLTLICSLYSLNMETPWSMWLRMESLRRCCAQSCVMTGGYSIIKTTLMRCWKVNESEWICAFVLSGESARSSIQLIFLYGSAQQSKMESTWRATLLGPCWTSLSGMKATPRGLACTTWTSGTKTSLATPKLLFSFTNASSLPTDFPTRER